MFLSDMGSKFKRTAGQARLREELPMKGLDSSSAVVYRRRGLCKLSLSIDY